MKHVCPRCGYHTTFTGNLHTHFERKYPCKPKLADIPFADLYAHYYKGEKCSKTENSKNDSQVVANSSQMIANDSQEATNQSSTSDSKFICKFCAKTYAHRSSMYKHIKKEHSNEPDLPTEDRKEIDVLKQQVSELTTKLYEKPQTQINNTINNQFFIVNNFGNEKLDYITDDYIQQSLKQPKSAINKIIRQIHFNPGRPENHNVKITNKKLPYVSVLKNNIWELDDKKKVINQMINRSYGIMDGVYNDKVNSLEPSTKRQYEKFQIRFDENDPKLKKDLEKSTELQILNEQRVLRKSSE